MIGHLKINYVFYNYYSDYNIVKIAKNRLVIWIHIIFGSHGEKIILIRFFDFEFSDFNIIVSIWYKNLYNLDTSYYI